MTFLIILVVSFVKVAARAFQQKNVMLDQHLLIIPTSYIMGYLEFTLLAVGVIDIVTNGWVSLIYNGFAYGTGGWMGALTAMWLHRRVVNVASQ